MGSHQGFVEIKRLARSDLVRTSEGDRLRIVKIERQSAPYQVYNLEVENTHTFFAEGVWVHNKAWQTGPIRQIGQIAARLPRVIKEIAVRAFRNNALLAELTLEEREIAACGYERIANELPLNGPYAEAARDYNLLRAKFLRGEIDPIAGTLTEHLKNKGLIP